MRNVRHALISYIITNNIYFEFRATQLFGGSNG